MCFVAWQRLKGNQDGHKIPRRHLIVRVTGIQDAPSHPTTPLGPSCAPKAHQKHVIGPKSSTLFCLVALRPILVVVRPTVHQLQISFAYYDTISTNPILSIAMVSRWCCNATKVIVSSVAMVSRWCRNATKVIVSGVAMVSHCDQCSRLCLPRAQHMPTSNFWLKFSHWM